MRRRKVQTPCSQTRAMASGIFLFIRFANSRLGNINTCSDSISGMMAYWTARGGIAISVSFNLNPISSSPLPLFSKRNRPNYLIIRRRQNRRTNFNNGGAGINARLNAAMGSQPRSLPSSNLASTPLLQPFKLPQFLDGKNAVDKI